MLLSTRGLRKINVEMKTNDGRVVLQLVTGSKNEVVVWLLEEYTAKVEAGSSGSMLNDSEQTRQFSQHPRPSIFCLVGLLDILEISISRFILYNTILTLQMQSL